MNSRLSLSPSIPARTRIPSGMRQFPAVWSSARGVEITGCARLRAHVYQVLRCLPACGLVFVLLLGGAACRTSNESNQRANPVRNHTEEEREGVQAMIRSIERTELPARMRWIYQINRVDPVEFAPEFILALRSPSPIVREVACKKLRYSANQEALLPLIRTLRSDPEAYVRRSAAVALGSFKSESVVQTLLEAAKTDAAADVRRFAVLSLKNLQANEATVPLAERLLLASDGTERDAAVLESILGTLEILGDQRVVPYLIRYFDQTGDPNVFDALAGIGGAHAAMFLQTTLLGQQPVAIRQHIPDNLLRLEAGTQDAFLIAQAQTNREPAIRAAIYRAARDAQLSDERRQRFVRAARESAERDSAPEVRIAAAGLVK